MKKLSVIIPAYNVEQYIHKCILSVIKNGISETSFEILVIDDESPDESVAIVEKLIKHYPNISLISQENRGLGGARNTGIRNATGQYLLFLDADDWYLPNTLQKLLDEVEKKPVDILEFGAQGVYPDGKIMYSRSMASEIMNGVDYYQKYRYLDSACNKLYCRNFLIDNELFFVEKLYIEDYEFNTRALFRTSKIKAYDLVVAQFFQSPDSITRNINRVNHLKMQDDIIQVIKKVDIFYKTHVSHNSSEQASDYFEQKLAFLTATLFYQLIKRNFSYQEIKTLRNRMRNENIFFVDHQIFETKKDCFRKIFLKHFLLLRVGMPLFKYI